MHQNIAKPELRMKSWASLLSLISRNLWGTVLVRRAGMFSWTCFVPVAATPHVPPVHLLFEARLPHRGLKLFQLLMVNCTKLSFHRFCLHLSVFLFL